MGSESSHDWNARATQSQDEVDAKLGMSMAEHCLQHARLAKSEMLWVAYPQYEWDDLADDC